MTVAEPVVEVAALSIEDSRAKRILSDVTLDVLPGEIHGLVGESGSGKTTTALAMLGYVAPGLRASSGSVKVAGREVLRVPARQQQEIRGCLISYVPQVAASSLNPRSRVGHTIERMRRRGQARATLKVRDLLELVDLPTTSEFLQRYPHQLSGGQQQRLAIAAALAPGPMVVVFDEPTTGLDAVVQDRLLESIDQLRRQIGFAAIFISHDIHAAQAVSDTATVLLEGRCLARGRASLVFSDPRHPYTRALMDALPVAVAGTRLVGCDQLRVPHPETTDLGCPFYTRCQIGEPACATEAVRLQPIGDRELACRRPSELTDRAQRHAGEAVDATPRPMPLLRVDSLVATHGNRRATTVVLHGLDLTVGAAERVAVVGESASGKTTLARCIAGLHDDWSGTIALNGETLARDVRGRSLQQLREVQLIFQNPAVALNPRRQVLDTIGLSGRLLRGLSRDDSREQASELLRAVEVDPALGNRYPRELSGGQLQRVGIAQALIAEPRLLVCDEITSALDVSVQASVVELLRELSDERGLSLLFITHDLGVVSSVAHRTVVVRHGRIVESGDTAQVFATPVHPYTEALLAHAGGGLHS